MSPDAYCRDRVLARGTNLYYAVLFLPAAQRSSVVALYALRHELRESVEHSSDASVAQARLSWWRDELGRLLRGEASHPVARALSMHCREWLAEHAADLAALVESVHIELGQTRFASFDDLEALCRRDAGSLGRLCARALGVAQEDGLTRAGELAVGNALAEVIERAGADARVGRIYFPIDELERFGVSAAQILAGRPGEGLSALLKFQAERARARIGAVLARMPASEQRALRPLMILLALSMRLLDECERDGFPVLQHQLVLTPLRRLVTAWRVWLGWASPL